MRKVLQRLTAAFMLSCLVIAGSSEGKAFAEEMTETFVLDSAETGAEDVATTGLASEDILKISAGKINYVIIEKTYLESPDMEKIAVSYGDGSEQVEKISLTVKDGDGESDTWDLSDQDGNLYLFERKFEAADESGVYEAVSLCVKDIYGYHEELLSSYGMQALFGVNEVFEEMEEYKPLNEETARADGVQEVPAEFQIAEVTAENPEETADTISESLEKAAGASLVGAMASRTLNAPAKGEIVVALDPGHDSKHAGAVSATGLREDVLTLKIANYCKEELEKYDGVRIHMTRTTEACPHPSNKSSGGDIGDRVKAASKAGASLFVSFHLNSTYSTAVRGALVIVPNRSWKPNLATQGEALATAILDELKAVGVQMRPNKIYSRDTTVGEKYPDGSKSDYFSVQIYSKEEGFPGIIVEHAFLSSPSDVNDFLNTEEKLKMLGIADATGIAKYLGLYKMDWRQEGDYTYLYENDEKVYGAKKVSGSWYYFDPDMEGAMYTGWRQDGEKMYHYDAEGKLALGVRKIEDSWYYFKPNGDMYKGWRKDGAKTYYYDEEGKLARGLWVIDEAVYFFQSNGIMCVGWRQDGEDRYFHDMDGQLVTGVRKISGGWYYFGEDGKMYTGWRQDGEKLYYYDTDGKLSQGVKKLEGNWYFFRSNGDMYIGWRQDGSKRYYYDEEGVLAQGVKKIDGSWYYFKSNGDMYKGWRQDGRKRYYYHVDGKLSMGKTVIGSKIYYFRSNGDMLVNGYADGEYYGYDGVLVR